MEKNTVKNGRLKKRILIHIMVILAFSMTVSTAISYVYFNRIVRNQEIVNEQTNLRQVSRRIEYMLEDIQNFARSIVVDENIQNGLENKELDSEFDRIKKSDTISKRLAFYNGLRLFLAGSFLVQADGEAYCSAISQQTDYLTKKLETEQIAEYLNHPEWTFSNPYNGIDTWENRELVCYRTNIMDKYNFGQPYGTLYLEISLRYFLEQVENYGMGKKNVCLIGNEEGILYEKENEGEISSLLQENPDCAEAGNHKVKEGYLLCEDIKGTGWKLCTLITNYDLWQQSSYVLLFFFLTFTLSILAILVTMSRQMEKIIEPITSLTAQMQQTSVERLRIMEPIHTGDEIQTLTEGYNEMVKEIQKGIDRKIEYEKQKREMEFDIMLSQINPHYLYNVLNTVVYMSAAGKNKEVVGIINSLIFSLQEILKLGDKNMETSVEKELELTRCYLNIQQYRYPELFDVEIDCDASLMQYMVPKTIIQPLVENALLHGILPQDKRGTIKIILKEEQESLWIFITDDGAGISDEAAGAFARKEEIFYKEGRKHIGISNVRDRVQYLYGEPFGMWIEKTGEAGTKVTLRLPLKKQGVSENYKI